MRRASSRVTRVIRPLLSAIGLPCADKTAVRTTPRINDAINSTFNLSQTSDPQLAKLATAIWPFDYATAKDLHRAAKVDAVLGQIARPLVFIPFKPRRGKWRCSCQNQPGSGRLAQKAVHAVQIVGALELALTEEVMQMGERRAEREGGLVAVEPRSEEHTSELQSR